MEQTNTFKYKGTDFTFCGFWEGKFAFYSNGKIIFISKIEELDEYLS